MLSAALLASASIVAGATPMSGLAGFGERRVESPPSTAAEPNPDR